MPTPAKDTFLADTINIVHFCRFCQHLDGTIDKPTCKAFPKGIPKTLINGQIFHNKPLPGQENDLVFKPLIAKK